MQLRRQVWVQHGWVGAAQAPWYRSVPRHRAIWWIASALTSPLTGARVRWMWNWKTSQHALTSSNVVPEFTGGGVEKWKGNHASFWPLNFVVASSPLQWYLWEGSGYRDPLCPLLPEIFDTEFSQEGLLILFFYYYFFFFLQGNCLLFQKCLLPVDMTWWHRCLCQQNQPAALGRVKSPTGC